MKGHTAITCDAWSASNGDEYYGVTAHWIEESENTWVLKMGVIGFLQMMKSHTGKRMGQALFKVCEQVGIKKKVCPLNLDQSLIAEAPLSLFSSTSTVFIYSSVHHSDWPCYL
jgi:hypothetical protein